ncbi:MAG: tetratricopeptide repeat protein, partial [Pseudanabaena sp.]
MSNPNDQQIEASHLQHLTRGIDLEKLGRFEEAINSYSCGLKIDPRSIELLYHYGRSLIAIGEKEKALITFEKALDIEPSCYKVLKEQAFLLFDLERLGMAIKYWDKALEIEPDDAYSWYKRGIALFRLDRIEEAINSYSRALEIKPDFNQAQYNYRNALINFYSYKYDSEDCIVWNKRGIDLLNEKRYEESLECWMIAIKIEEDNDQAWFYQGITLQELNRYEEAIASYDRVIANYDQASASHDQDLIDNQIYYYAWNNKGASLFHLERYEEALESFDYAIRINPDSELAQRNRDLALDRLKYNTEGGHNSGNLTTDSEQEMQQQTSGRRVYVKGIRTFLSVSFIVFLSVILGKPVIWFIGIILSNLLSISGYIIGIVIIYYFFYWFYQRGDKLTDLAKYEEALNHFNGLIKISRKLPHVWYERGIVLRRLGRYEEAIASYDQALKIKQNYHEAWNNRGIVLADLGRHEEAIASYDKSLSIRFRSMPLVNKGRSLTSLGCYEEALYSFNEALKIEKPNSSKSQTLHVKGIVLLLLGESHEALNSQSTLQDIETSASYYEQAVRCFNEALVFTLNIDELVNQVEDLAAIPSEQRDSVRMSRYFAISSSLEYAKGKLAEIQGEVGLAIAYYQKSLSDFDQAYTSEPRERRKNDLLEGTVSSIFASLVNVLVKVNRLDEAIEIVEKAKGKKLKEQFKDFTNRPFRTLPYSHPVI